MCNMIRVVYYMYPWFLDPALPKIRVIARSTDLHLLLELSPEGWQQGLFDAAPKLLSSGIIPASPVIGDCFPAGVKTYWQGTASFNLAVHNCPKSIHPATWWVSHKVVRFIRSLKPDILHLDDVSLRVAWALPGLGKIPIVLNIHDPEPHSGEHNWRTDMARWLTFRRVKRFIMHSTAGKADFCARWGVSESHVVVVPLGVYDVFCEWMNPTIQEEDRTVLFFGRLSPYKGLEVLYRAAPIVAEQVPGVRFVVVGRPIRGYQPPAAPSLSNQGRIEQICDYVSNARLAELFQRATMVVCPYTDATQSGVILTAYAFGKPVVATTVGGLPEYVTDDQTGILVPPNDSESLAAAIVGLLVDRTRRERLSKGIQRARATELGWDRIAQQTIKVYEEALIPSRVQV